MNSHYKFLNYLILICALFTSPLAQALQPEEWVELKRHKISANFENSSLIGFVPPHINKFAKKISFNSTCILSKIDLILISAGNQLAFHELKNPSPYNRIFQVSGNSSFFTTYRVHLTRVDDLDKPCNFKVLADKQR